MRRKILTAILCCLILGLIVGHLLDDARAAHSPDVSSGTTIETGLQTSRTLCERSEQVVFSCNMQKSAKLLSICTSKKLDTQNGYVQYRFGLPGKVELEFPADRVNSQAAFSYERYTRPLVTFLTVRFESNGYKYSIHQDSNAEWKPPQNASYLDVTSPDANEKPVEMKCKHPVIGSLMLLEDVVPRSEGMDAPAP